MRGYLNFYFGGESRDLQLKCTENQYKFLTELLEQLNDSIGVPSEAGFELFDESHSLLVDPSLISTKVEKVSSFVDFTEL